MKEGTSGMSNLRQECQLLSLLIKRGLEKGQKEDGVGVERQIVLGSS